jgi:hypothetical protein
MDQARVAQYQWRRGDFAIERSAGQQPAFGLRKPVLYYMKARQCNHSLAQTAGPVDQNSLHLVSQRVHLNLTDGFLSLSPNGAKCLLLALGVVRITNSVNVRPAAKRLA